MDLPPITLLTFPLLIFFQYLIKQISLQVAKVPGSAEPISAWRSLIFIYRSLARKRLSGLFCVLVLCSWVPELRLYFEVLIQHRLGVYGMLIAQYIRFCMEEPLNKTPTSWGIRWVHTQSSVSPQKAGMLMAAGALPASVLSPFDLSSSADARKPWEKPRLRRQSSARPRQTRSDRSSPRHGRSRGGLLAPTSPYQGKYIPATSAEGFLRHRGDPGLAPGVKRLFRRFSWPKSTGANERPAPV